MTKAKMQEEDPFEHVVTSTRGVTGRSGRFVMIALGVLLAWAIFVPLGSAVIAPATLVSSAHNQLLQHLAGGRVKQILANEGDLIEQGQAVIELDPILDQARLTGLQARIAVLKALRNRLQAQKADDPDEGALPALSGMSLRLGGAAELDRTTTASLADTPIERMLNAEQLRELDKGRRAIAAQLRGLSDRIEGQRKRFRALGAQVRSSEQRIELLEEQLAGARGLAKAGDISRQQVWDLEARLLDARSQLSNLRSQMADADSSINETEAEMERVRMSDGRDTSQQLTEVLAEIEQISDELAAAEYTRSQAALRAPVRGYLVHLKAETSGGIIGPGETVAEIVPVGVPLEIKARVPLDKINAVHIGQEAELKVSALNPRIYDPLPAKVSYVAADASMNEQTGERFYEIRASVDMAAAEAAGAKLLPGMSGEVYITGESRTFATYMLQPILDGLMRSFREVH